MADLSRAEHADVVIVGSGIAALRAVLALDPRADVLLVTKSYLAESNTGYAQGGIAAAVGPDDSSGLHAADTVRAGDGLCDEEAVQVLVAEGRDAVRELADWDTRFDREPDGSLALAREGAHSVRRVLHAADATGREIARALWARVLATRAPRILEHATVLDLVMVEGACRGVRFSIGDGPLREARGRAVLLATGGAGQVFRETTNPEVATGDGIAIAWRAGARVADLEFVQFHPTALDVPGAPRFLLSEALRGEGARLVNEHDEPFMERYEPMADLAARDRVARATIREQARTGGRVYLSLRHLGAAHVHRRFPGIALGCRRAGLDLARDRIPVGPAAHYVMGGVETDCDGRTSVPGLFAAGEVACTGVHGANRLASNSLLEGLVFGKRAGAAIGAALESRGMPAAASALRGVVRPLEAGPLGPDATVPASVAAVRNLMWTRVGLIRDRDGLELAVGALEAAHRAAERDRDARPTADTHALANLVAVARLMARAALRRDESRGGHFREDAPARDDVRWRVHVCEEHAPVAGSARAGSGAIGRDDRHG